MDARKPYSEATLTVDRLSKAIRSILDEHSAAIQAGVLTDLLALWVARQPGGYEAFLIRAVVSQTLGLIPVHREIEQGQPKPTART